MLERGQREGYLKVRTPAEIAPILFSGYGATIGQHHLAGVCSLQTERYEAERAGEIVGLYTITRFKGEGVGVKLIACMKTVGRERGLAFLFACTTQERVGQFFERQGFRQIPQSEAPPAKWIGYDEDAAPRARGLSVRSIDFGPVRSGACAVPMAVGARRNSGLVPPLSGMVGPSYARRHAYPPSGRGGARRGLRRLRRAGRRPPISVRRARSVRAPGCTSS